MPALENSTSLSPHHGTARRPKKVHTLPGTADVPTSVQMMPLQSFTNRPDSLAAARSGSRRSDHGTCLPPIPALTATEATGIPGCQRVSTLAPDRLGVCLPECVHVPIQRYTEDEQFHYTENLTKCSACGRRKLPGFNFQPLTPPPHKPVSE